MGLIVKTLPKSRIIKIRQVVKISFIAQHTYLLIICLSQTLPKFGSGSKAATRKAVSSSKTGSKSPVPQDVNREEFQKQCLERHNHYRAKHGVNPLKLNAEV